MSLGPVPLVKRGEILVEPFARAVPGARTGLLAPPDKDFPPQLWASRPAMYGFLGLVEPVADCLGCILSFGLGRHVLEYLA